MIFQIQLDQPSRRRDQLVGVIIGSRGEAAPHEINAIDQRVRAPQMTAYHLLLLPESRLAEYQRLVARLDRLNDLRAQQNGNNEQYRTQGLAAMDAVSRFIRECTIRGNAVYFSNNAGFPNGTVVFPNEDTNRMSITTVEIIQDDGITGSHRSFYDVYADFYANRPPFRTIDSVPSRRSQ